MHDVIRDMTINISTKNSRFMVKAGRLLTDIPSEIKWSENLERVSLMDCQHQTWISVPNCPKLTTLFLQSGTGVYEVLNACFANMQGRKVLDLSYANISFLPDSISDLVNLRALFLCHCEELNHVPSLDLSGSAVEALPNGIENLFLLKRLALSNMYNILNKNMSLGRTFPNLVHLQCLRTDGGAYINVEVEELIEMGKLEILGVKFSGLHKFNSYMRTEHYLRLTTISNC